MDVVNESYMHNVPEGSLLPLLFARDSLAPPAGSESHFKVIVVSESFDGVALIQRHRAVNETLAAELKGEVVEGVPPGHPP
jgi:BolA protein